ncbi:uncharacterized protein N7483_010592 [Penicillium malachiteum]|uniref:uncharacterized protein n=1 Tax=Penicillium malachiteum TaxID=1324776 RepID=UPI002547AD65|nr:uncharacterized protein N7483_010592 [Penicillium malachiteum]KAJ5713411.1 hypothetical protein N7483_010592 [Penicillium malachiteum]
MLSVVIPGRPCLTDAVAVDPQPNGQCTKFAFSIPFTPSFNELVVFLLPGTILPPNTGAAIYAQLPDPTTGAPTNFRFIGALANEQPSGLFSIYPPGQAPNNSNTGTGMRSESEENEMLDDTMNANPNRGTVLTLGISIEEVQNITPQLAELENEKAGGSNALALVPAAQKQISTKVLAQRIIGSAFNFLASFAESDPKNKGHEVIPLKSFRDWWTKFERRIDMDPTFLEREDPNAS